MKQRYNGILRYWNSGILGDEIIEFSLSIDSLLSIHYSISREGGLVPRNLGFCNWDFLGVLSRKIVN